MTTTATAPAKGRPADTTDQVIDEMEREYEEEDITTDLMQDKD